MLIKILLIVIVMVTFTAAPGCKKQSDSDAPQQQTEITKENLSSELDKLESEINSDAAAQE